MRKGFTILELLVASLLLGMLVTILTMIFNQSSIAWRTGVAGVARMDEARDDIAQVREEADNLFFYSNKVGRITSLWDKEGNLRKRAYSLKGSEGAEKGDTIVMLANVTPNNLAQPLVLDSGAETEGFKSYTIGVTSRGPDPDSDADYDDITSWPDEIQW